MTSNSTPADIELIVFRLASIDYCVDIMQVREIRGWTPATPIPHAQHYMLGVINLRGTVLPIIDLADRFGLPPSQPNERNAIIVTEVKNQLVGLLVDSVSDIISIDRTEIQPTPEVAVGHSNRDFVTGVIGVEGRMVSLVSIEAIMPRHKAEAA
ncbi:MAG: chemotaxis protein CheW [Proteobacteria bacterium]|nr:chemotaxis protein CheW [Pseudomonadota bacterium]